MGMPSQYPNSLQSVGRQACRDVFQAPRQVKGLVISGSAVARLKQIGGRTGALRSGWHVEEEEEECLAS